MSPGDQEFRSRKLNWSFDDTHKFKAIGQNIQSKSWLLIGPLIFCIPFSSQNATCTLNCQLAECYSVSSLDIQCPEVQFDELLGGKYELNQVDKGTRYEAVAQFSVQFIECPLKLNWLSSLLIPQCIHRTDCLEVYLLMNWLNTILRTVSSKYRWHSGNWWHGVHRFIFIFSTGWTLFRTCPGTKHTLKIGQACKEGP